MRLFIAIDLPNEIKEEIHKVAKTISPKCPRTKFVESHNLHITLKFLGEVGEDDVNPIISSLNLIPSSTAPFRLSINGIGTFGKDNKIRTVWAGITSGREDYVKLANQVIIATNKINDEKRKPSAHITIARTRHGFNPNILNEQIRKFQTTSFGEFEVKKFTLKQSILTPQGPIYSNIKKFPLI